MFKSKHTHEINGIRSFVTNDIKSLVLIRIDFRQTAHYIFNNIAFWWVGLFF